MDLVLDLSGEINESKHEINPVNDKRIFDIITQPNKSVEHSVFAFIAATLQKK